ncbi:uncharacterized protein B4U79_13245, partial [Dinothrombium tinctorium]
MADETRDHQKRSIINLNSNVERMRSYLIFSAQIENQQSATIIQAVPKSLNLIYGENIDFEKILFLSDAAPVMKAVGKSLVGFCPKIIHVTCLAHTINTVAEKIRALFSSADQLFPSLPLPPEPVITRWSTWLQSVNYCASNYEKLAYYLEKVKDDESGANEILTELLLNPQSKNELAIVSTTMVNVHRNLLKIPEKARKVYEKFNEVMTKNNTTRNSSVVWYPSKKLSADFRQNPKRRRRRKKKGSGAKRKLQADDLRRVQQLAHHHPKWSSAQIAFVAAQRGTPLVHKTTIWRNLRLAGYCKWVPKTIPLLTDAHKSKRFYRHKVREWGKSRPEKGTPKHGLQIMVWSGISCRGATPLKVAMGSVNSDVYQDILGEFLLPSMSILYPEGYVLQQDNARPHTAESTIAWLNSIKLKILKWPACSPYLNPIENLWFLIKDRLEKLERTDFSTWASAITEIWDNLSHEYMESLINSMPRRIEK